MIYFDNNATTPIDPQVMEVMESVYFSQARNPSSTHRFGQKAKAFLATAIAETASFFKINKQELIFTSGATEAINLFLKGFFAPTYKGHLITSALEHVAVYSTAQWLQKQGVSVTFLSPLEGRGAITKEQVEQALRPDTRLVALIGVNNETGVKTDLASIAPFLKSKDLPFFVDGVSWLGKEPVLLHEGITAACFSGHKIHGPLGVGLLWIKKGEALEPLILGGPQQHGMRGGTENLPAIVGFAKALSLLTSNASAYKHMATLRDRFEKGIQHLFPEVQINGGGERVGNTSNLYFPGIDGEMLLMKLDLAGLAASFGSACSSGSLEFSRVLLNMGYSRDRVSSSLRFSFSRMTTDAEIERGIAMITHAITG